MWLLCFKAPHLPVSPSGSWSLAHLWPTAAPIWHPVTLYTVWTAYVCLLSVSAPKLYITGRKGIIMFIYIAQCCYYVFLLPSGNLRSATMFRCPAPTSCALASQCLSNSVLSWCIRWWNNLSFVTVIPHNPTSLCAYCSILIHWKVWKYVGSKKFLLYSNTCLIGGILGSLSMFDVCLRWLRKGHWWTTARKSFLGVVKMTVSGGSWARRNPTIDMVALDMFLSACPVFKRRGS